MANPLKTDPSRTKTLRDKFSRDLRKRLNRKKKAIREILIEKDVFGLAKRKLNVVSNSEGEYSCVMLMLPELDTIWNLISEPLQWSDPQLKREMNPHVTILYGLHPTEELQEQLEELAWEEIEIQFTDFQVFEGEENDVVYLGVEPNQDLENLNQSLKQLPYTNQFSQYKPHVTFGYFHPGMGQGVADQLNQKLEFSNSVCSSTFVLSNPERKQTVLNVEVLDRQFEFATDSQKIEEFENLLATQVEGLEEGETVYEAYVREGYAKGAGRAWSEANRGKLATSVTDLARGFVDGRKSEFLVGMLNGPESVDKLHILAARTFKDIVGISNGLDKQLRQHLADGLVQGDNPRVIARRMFKQIGVTQRQAERIARTEIIRAHAEGQLDALERMGVDEVGVAVEYSTAGDDRVCPRCAPLEGVVLKVKKSHGLIPMHPNCRCAWVPAIVGETRKSRANQVRGQKAIDRRRKQSIKAGSKLKDRKLVAEPKATKTK